MRNCVIVLGMHRSGTSAATGVLSLLGGDIGATVMETNPMNPKGFYENQRFRELNDRILATFGASWDDPFGLPAGWETAAELDGLRKCVRKALAGEFSAGPLKLIKDPRLCLLLPFWQPLFEDSGLEPGYVLVVRHPLESAASLTAGYGFSTQKGALLWMRHMLAAEAFTRGRSRIFVAFNDLLSHPQRFWERVATVLEIDCPRSWGQAEKEVQAFLDPGLKHHTHGQPGPTADSVHAMAPMLATHDILCRLAGGRQPEEAPADTAALEKIRERFHADLDLFYHPEILKPGARGRAAAELETVLKEREARIEAQRLSIARLEAQAAARGDLLDRWAGCAEGLVAASERLRRAHARPPMETAGPGMARLRGGSRTREPGGRVGNGTPAVSIILPVRNAADALEPAVRAILRQTFPSREIIVVDGGSCDGTREVLKRLADRIDYWESAPDRGIYDAMNRGIDAARGEWLYFMGVDDAFDEDGTLAALMTPGTVPETADLIVGNVVQGDGRLFRSRFGRRLLLRNSVHHQSAFYRRRVFERFRYGRPETSGARPYRISGDYQLNLRLFVRGSRAHRVDRVIARCGLGASQQGRLVGYVEEMMIRHAEIPFWAAIAFDFQTVARYMAKKFTRRLRRC